MAGSDTHNWRRPTDAPWTAARCSRVLRQLQALLRKLQKWEEERESDKDEPDDAKELHIHEATAGESPLPRTKKKMYGAKYTSKKKSAVPETPKPKSSTKRPDSLVAQTPNTILRPAVNYSLSARCPDKISLDQRYKLMAPHGCGGRRPRKITFSRGCSHEDKYPYFSFDLAQRSQMDPSSYEYIALDVEDVVTKFLVGTSSSSGPLTWKHVQPQDERGCRSLRTLCLRRLAQEKVQEQKDLDSEADRFDLHDLIGDFLRDLEEYFGHGTTGWPPLREVIRHFGISAISEAIRSGYLRQNVARELIVSTLGSPLTADAGEAFAKDGLVKIQRPVTLTKTHGDMFHCRNMPAFLALSQYPHSPLDAHRTSLIHATILEAVQSEDCPLSPHWITQGSVFNKILSGSLISTVAPGLILEVYLRALQPMDIRAKYLTVTTSSNPHTDARLFDELKQGVFTMLLKALISQSDRVLTMVSILVIRVLVLLESRPVTEMRPEQKTIVGYILFIHFATASLDGRACFPVAGKHLVNIERDLQSREELSAGLRTMLLQTGVECIQRSHLDKFQSLITALVDHSIDASATSLQTFANVSRDAAMELAGCYDESHLIEWAGSLQNTSRQNRDEDHKDAFASMRASVGYRWEDSVNEWVARTPVKYCTTGSGLLRKDSTGPVTTLRVRPLGKMGTSDFDVRIDRKRKNMSSEWQSCQVGDFAFKKRVSLVDDCQRDNVHASAKEVHNDSARPQSGIGVQRMVPHVDDDSADELSFVDDGY